MRSAASDRGWPAPSTLTPPADRLDDDGVVARRQDEHLGEAAAQDRRRRPGGPCRRDTVMSDVERDAAEDGPVGQTGQQPCRQLVASRRRRCTALAITVGHERPRASGPDRAPRPRRPARAARSPSRRAASGRCRPSQPSVGEVAPEGRAAPRSRPRAGARAAPRESCLARKSEAVCPRARWSSVMAIGMAERVSLLSSEPGHATRPRRCGCQPRAAQRLGRSAPGGMLASGDRVGPPPPRGRCLGREGVLVDAHGPGTACRRPSRAAAAAPGRSSRRARRRGRAASRGSSRGRCGP